MEAAQPIEVALEGIQAPNGLFAIILELPYSISVSAIKFSPSINLSELKSFPDLEYFTYRVLFPLSESELITKFTTFASTPDCSPLITLPTNLSR